ncbi:hypothetical protein ACFLIM_27295 [Nonomuraea sp. M3C6]|uniref:Helicase XPB/Ssl2 N-terminal domain-containing protein n=1 Tax=Nonomuraea marmarensis TaxID=3351344 RepID=A0ABW7AIN0_9ACTN
MRTYFEPEEDEEFEAAKDLLIRRALSWAEGQGLPADGLLLSAAVDSRHRSRDGRLAFWDSAQVRRYLLEWIPQYVVAPRDVLDAAPETLLTLLRYLIAAGLRDPRGATLAELESAVAATATEYPAALADPQRLGLAKFWAQTALDSGFDLTDRKSLDRFQRDIDAGRVAYDAEVLDQVMKARFTRLGLDEERAYPQPPLVIDAKVGEAAAGSEIVRQLSALVDWTGTDGRTLTGTGNLRLADARELAAHLGTGEQDLQVRSATELPRLNLLLAWAKSTRLVRVSKGRLLRVAKAAPLLRDPERLWSRAFEVFFDLGRAIGVPPGSMLVELFDELLPDVLNSVYGLPDRVPVTRLQETVWLACQDYLQLDEDDFRQQTWRRHVERDLVEAFELLAALGAVELSHGVADELYTSDLDEEDQPLPPEARARLRTRLAEPGLLVRLTPLGLRAVRERMLAEGRDVPLVGELVDASPGELLGVLAQHYTPETASVELDGWLAARGGGVEPLLDAVRACPFRARAAAMLGTLAEVRADGQSMLKGLRADRVLAPIAVTALLDTGDLRPEDLSTEEQLALMTEGLLTLLELAGPEEVMRQVTSMAGQDAFGIIEAVSNSGHPADESMREFRTLVAEPMRARSHGLRFANSSRPGSRGRHSGHGKRRKR